MKTNNVQHSFLELAIVSEGETIEQTLQNSLRLAKAAEESNYHRFWFAEHHNAENIGSSATALLIQYVAGKTNRIRVGSGGIMLPNHSALIVAEQFGTLARLYPDRIDLGLGRAPGTDQQTAQAIRSDFFKATQLFPQEVAKIQQYFSLDNRRSPVRAPIAEGMDVPLYILGSSTDSAHLAAAKGLPYAFASHFASTYLMEALEIYRREFQPSDQLERPYSMPAVNIYLAESEDQAKRFFSPVVRMFVGILTGSRMPLQPPEEFSDELEKLLQHPSLHQMLRYSFVGSKETVKPKLRKFLSDTAADELIVVSAIHGIEDRIRSVQLLAELMDELRAE